MTTYIVTLAARETTPVTGLRNRTVEHEGHLTLAGGALIFSPEPFGAPYIGYAPGTWLRFEKKEA